MNPTGRRTRIFRALVKYGIGSFLFCLFGSVYTYFGHGVVSASMTFCFLPLLSGFAFYGLLLRLPLPYPDLTSARLLAYGLVALSFDLIVNGILDIAGAFADSEILLKAASFLLLGASVIRYLIFCFRPGRPSTSAEGRPSTEVEGHDDTSDE